MKTLADMTPDEREACVGMWCEGGWHRSVALAGFVKRRMARSGHTVQIEHLGVIQ